MDDIWDYIVLEPRYPPLQMQEQTIVFLSAAIIWYFTVCKVAMSTLTAFSMDEAII